MKVIRLSLHGAKKRPFYRVVVANKSCRRDGRFIELVGTFNPMAAGQELRLVLKLDRIMEHVGQGAQCTKRVQSLINEWRKINNA